MRFRMVADALLRDVGWLAGKLGRSYRTIQAYRYGEVDPPTDVWKRCAAVLRAQARRLDALAARCDDEAARRAGDA